MKYSKLFYDQPHKTQVHVITVSLISPCINETIRLYATVYYGNQRGRTIEFANSPPCACKKLFISP